ncbi:MAG: hypothetical protein HY754_10100 [Nitrospirae bacterium]|nr:hypothetical protein [Nitrospirota bacterium]
MRGIMQVLSNRDIKSIHSVGVRSIPKVQRSGYLELYMLRRERDRLDKEIVAIDKRRGSANRQLNSINKRIEKLQQETDREQKLGTHRNIPARPLKTVSIAY